LYARIIFAMVRFAARKGLAETRGEISPKQRARRTGVRGETYAYWYLRRHGYTLVARNFTMAGVKGEIDMAAYDGSTLAFVEVKTRSPSAPGRATPEEAVDAEKRRNLVRMAQAFLRARHLDSSDCRFDVLAIEARPGASPLVRLHKNAFRPELPGHGI
jgi:putative endonuclease